MRYSTVLLDWGDTVMYDDPTSLIPMVEWDSIRLVDGITELLRYLQTSGRQIMLATSASVSDERQIWGALQRGGLAEYFSKIYCFKNTQLSKGETFYRHILNDLQIPATEVLMVGDTFEKDVQAARAAGLFAIWFNPRSTEVRGAEGFATVHSLSELLAWVQALDAHEP